MVVWRAAGRPFFPGRPIPCPRSPPPSRFHASASVHGSSFSLMSICNRLQAGSTRPHPSTGVPSHSCPFVTASNRFHASASGGDWYAHGSLEGEFGYAARYGCRVRRSTAHAVGGTTCCESGDGLHPVPVCKLHDGGALGDSCRPVLQIERGMYGRPASARPVLVYMSRRGQSGRSRGVRHESARPPPSAR